MKKKLFIIFLICSVISSAKNYLLVDQFPTSSPSSLALKEQYRYFHKVKQSCFYQADSVLTEIRSQIKRSQEKARYYRCRAELSYFQGDLDQLRIWYDSVTLIINDGKISYNDLQKLAWYEWYLGAKDRSLILYDSAIRLAQNKEGTSFIAELKLDMVEILLEKWQLEKAELLLVTVFQMSNFPIDKTVGRKARLARIWWIYKRGDLQLSLDSAHQLEKSCLRELDTFNLIRTYELKAQIYYHLGDYPPAIDNYRLVLDHHRSSGNLVGVAQQLGYISYAHRMMGSFSESVEYAKMKIAVCDSLGDESRKGDAYIRLYQVYHDNKQPDLALDVVDKAMEIYKKYEAESGIAVAHNSYGNIYESLKDYPRALHEYEQALKIFRTRPKARWVVPLYNIGHVKVLMGAYQESLPFFEESLEICEEQYIIGMRIRNQSGLATAYLSLGQIERAKGLIDEAIQTVGNTKYQRMKRDVYELSSKIYEKSGLFEEALNYHQLFKNQNDNIFNEESDRRFATMEVAYKTKEKEQENQLLRQDVALKEASIQSQRYWTIITVIILGFSLLGGFLIYQNNRSLNEKNRKISTQRQSIAQRNDRIETLLREVHHRVKNNLQLITSLLDIDLDEYTSQNAFDVLKESQNRVATMSLIHQNLYMNDDFNQIDVHDYIEQLVSQLAEINALQTDITFELESEEYLFDVDTMVPLGLIITELVTNAFKYSIKEENDYYLKISITELDENHFQLTVSDKGENLSKPLETHTQHGYGLRLASRLSLQLSGELTHEYDHGNHFSVIFRHENQ